MMGFCSTVRCCHLCRQSATKKKVQRASNGHLFFVGPENAVQSAPDTARFRHGEDCSDLALSTQQVDVQCLRIWRSRAQFISISICWWAFIVQHATDIVICVHACISAARYFYILYVFFSHKYFTSVLRGQ